MQVVIKIPDEQYDVIKGDLYNTFPSDMRKWGLEAIKNGVPLPKGHGDLIDKSDLLTTTDIRADGSEFTYVPYYEIEDAPTLIETDKE